MKNVSCISLFYHFVGVCFSTFFRIWASLRWWREAQIRTKCKKIEKHPKIDPKKDTIFIRIRSFSWCFCSLVFGGVLGSVFLRFGRRNVPNGGYLGTLFQLCCSKAGKLKTSVSFPPNTTFPGFEGLGQDVLRNFFQHLFWDGFWDVVLPFFREIEGPAVAPKTTFGEHFRYTFHVDFLWIFNGKPDSEPARGYGD